MAGRSALLIDATLLSGEPTPPARAFLARMRGADVAVVPLGQPGAAWRSEALGAPVERPAAWRPGPLLSALRAVQAETTASWLVCADAGVSAIEAAASAGLAGVVLIGVEPPPGDHGLAVTSARDLADVPRALVPRDGGCWHERK